MQSLVRVIFLERLAPFCHTRAHARHATRRGPRKSCDPALSVSGNSKNSGGFSCHRGARPTVLRPHKSVLILLFVLARSVICAKPGEPLENYFPETACSMAIQI